MRPLIAFARMLVLAGCSLAVVSAAQSPKLPPVAEYFVYFGTYTGGKSKSKGIYRARLDVATGKLSEPELAIEAGDPAFLAVHPKGGYLYAINERSDPKTTPGKGLMAYAIEAGTGKLTLLNEQSAGGPGPCHLAVDAQGKCVVVANYGGGSTVAVKLLSDGRLGDVGSVIQHAGKSVHPTRQTAPHAHVVALTPEHDFALVADLGLDQVLTYKLDPAKAELVAHKPPFTALTPGAGPRHIAFRPDGKFVYVINELTCTMTTFRLHARRGTLEELQTVSTLPAGVAVERGYSTAEVIAHPGGKFLYGSNRGHDTIAVFAIEEATGKLTLVENVATQGKAPRHFAVDPSGGWLLAENQNSDSVVVFRIDAKTGRLTPTGQKLEIPVPVCAVFVAAK
ncbi:MAG: lactonase family protein [Verrucomicrobiota bacterium]